MALDCEADVIVELLQLLVRVFCLPRSPFFVQSDTTKLKHYPHHHHLHGGWLEGNDLSSFQDGMRKMANKEEGKNVIIINIPISLFIQLSYFATNIFTSFLDIIRHNCDGSV